MQFSGFTPSLAASASAFSRFNPHVAPSYAPQYGAFPSSFGTTLHPQQPPWSTHSHQPMFGFGQTPGYVPNPFNNTYIPSRGYSSFQPQPSYDPSSSQRQRGTSQHGHGIGHGQGQAAAYYDPNQNFGDTDQADEDDADSSDFECEDEEVVSTPSTSSSPIDPGTPSTNTCTDPSQPSAPPVAQEPVENSNPYWKANSGWRESSIRGSAAEHCQSAYDKERSKADLSSKRRQADAEWIKENGGRLMDSMEDLSTKYTSLIDQFTRSRPGVDRNLAQSLRVFGQSINSAYGKAKTYMRHSEQAVETSQEEIDAMRNMAHLKKAVDTIKSSSTSGISVGDARYAFKKYGSQMKEDFNGEQHRSPFESLFMSSYNNARNDQEIPFRTSAPIAPPSTEQARSNAQQFGTQPTNSGTSSPTSAPGRKPDINDIFGQSTGTTFNPWTVNPNPSAWGRNGLSNLRSVFGSNGYGFNGYNGFRPDQYNQFGSQFGGFRPQPSQLDQLLASLLSSNTSTNANINSHPAAYTSSPSANLPSVAHPQPAMGMGTGTAYSNPTTANASNRRYAGGLWGGERPGEVSYVTGLRPGKC
ncbi:uncharacterized protein I303_100025 [Kwoniella dejecticola CBS 10117]|uniref:Uncharacterized protein n=1 Tax=Kwoniella dejecticola CBS 10117 TaxID=1296121 RepID=A0A1A6ADU5_9TREE|nr:uncharacterized protein I303_00025 [Kwoniella dejecticola CBS 10117]OBR88214.1 hypothetical protein I303_00025 [Kwoniella dejecticola CBS 10117]